MRRVLCARLLAASAVVLMVALTTIASALPASARGASTGNKPVKCATINGNVGGEWSLMGCNPVNIVGPGNNAEQGAQGTSGDFPSSPGSTSATITWTSVNQQTPALVTVINITVTDKTGRHDKCGPLSAEVELSGTIGSNSASPGIKGHVKIFVCEGSDGAVGGALSNPKRALF